MCLCVIPMEPNHVLLPKQSRIAMVPKPCTTFKIYYFKYICESVVKPLQIPVKTEKWYTFFWEGYHIIYIYK